MKIKRLIMIIVFSLSLVSCQNHNLDKTNVSTSSVTQYSVNNSKPLEEILSKTYSLKELTDYFGKIPPNENSIYSSTERALQNKSALNINNINRKFPIECLRKNGNIGYYSVYKVQEGGYFYVFWSVYHSQNIKTDEIISDAQVYFSTYISTLKSASSFDSIKTGISTANDVAKVDPALEVTFLMSSGIRSFSLLNDRSIMEIAYENSSQKISSRNDLIVKSKSIIPKEDLRQASYLSLISAQDLP